MSNLTKHLPRTRRAALIGLLVAVPLLPLSGCGEGENGGGDSEVENEDTGSEDEDEDGGLY